MEKGHVNPRPRDRREDNTKTYLEEVGWRELTGLIWLRTGTGACECGTEVSGSIKCGEFLS